MTTHLNKALQRSTTGAVRRLVVPVMLLLVIAAPAGAKSGDSCVLVGFRGDPEVDSLPEGWDHVTYLGKNKNEFRLEADRGTVLRVRSLNSVSALLATPDVDIAEYPLLAWRWKVDRVVGMAREDRRDRNDCAARVRVVFKTPQSAPTGDTLARRVLKLGGVDLGAGEPDGKKIDYVWGNYLPQGTVVAYPGARDHFMIFLQSGGEKAGRWVWEKRDLRADYERCFGGEPPDIAGLLVLTDTDRTKEGVTAHFGSVVLLKREHDETP